MLLAEVGTINLILFLNMDLNLPPRMVGEVDVVFRCRAGYSFAIWFCSVLEWNNLPSQLRCVRGAASEILGWGCEG